MRVSADHQVDRIVEPRDQTADVGGAAVGIAQVAGAAVDVVGDRWVDRAGDTVLESALVHQHDDAFDPPLAQPRHQVVDRLRFVVEGQAGHTGGRDDGRRRPQRHADESHLDALERLDAVGRQQRLAGPGLDHVGRQPLEVGSVERAGSRRSEPLAAVGVGQAAGVLAAAVLQTAQLVLALVELVVAHRREVDTDLVQRLDGRLVEEQRRDQWRRADEVTGSDHHRVLVGGLHPRDIGRQVLRTAHRIACRTRHQVDTKVAGRFEVAVVVVDADDLDGDRLLGSGARLHGGQTEEGRQGQQEGTDHHGVLPPDRVAKLPRSGHGVLSPRVTA